MASSMSRTESNGRLKRPIAPPWPKWVSAVNQMAISIRDDRGAARPHKTRDGTRDLGAAAYRGLDRVGEIVVAVADQPQIDQRQLACEGLAGDAIVEHR